MSRWLIVVLSVYTVVALSILIATVVQASRQGDAVAFQVNPQIQPQVFQQGQPVFIPPVQPQVMPPIKRSVIPGFKNDPDIKVTMSLKAFREQKPKVATLRLYVRLERTFDKHYRLGFDGVDEEGHKEYRPMTLLIPKDTIDPKLLAAIKDEEGHVLYFDFQGEPFKLLKIYKL